MIADCNFCLKCGSSFKPDGSHLVCTSCGFEFYEVPKLFANIIVLNDVGEVLLARRKYDPHVGMWNTVGGFVEVGETMEEAARREVREETGLEIKDLVYLCSHPDVYPYQGIEYKSLAITFIAHIVSGEMAAADDASHIQFFKPDEIPMDEMAFASDKAALIDYLAKL